MAKSTNIETIIRYSGFKYIRNNNLFTLECKDTHQTFTANYWQVNANEWALSIEHDFDFSEKHKKYIEKIIHWAGEKMPNLVVSVVDLREDDTTDEQRNIELTDEESEKILQD